MQSSLFQNQPLQYRCIWGKTIQNIFVKFFVFPTLTINPPARLPFTVVNKLHFDESPAKVSIKLFNTIAVTAPNAAAMIVLTTARAMMSPSPSCEMLA